MTDRATHIIELSSDDYQKTIVRVAGLGLSSGMIYDALPTTAAEKAGAERVLTFNEKHFHRVWPEGAGITFAP